MKKRFLLISILFLFGCSDRPANQIAIEENYYFSNNETACAFIFYEVEGAPALEIENGVIHYYFDDWNIITTSSPYDFGWRSKEDGGWRDVHYYRQDGTKIEEITNFGNGTVIYNDVEYDYASFYFGEQPCFSKDTDPYMQLQSLVKQAYQID